MMATNRSNGSNGERFPSPATLKQLRTALARYVASGSADEQSVCDALAVLAEEAQARQLRAEAMLIVFKEVWAELPEANAITDRAERDRLLDRVVRLCIDSYYQR